MSNTQPSIFNNVIGPVMRGPSSSPTAAAVRIGLLARKLLGEEPVREEVVFDRNGSLNSPAEYHGLDLRPGCRPG